MQHASIAKTSASAKTGNTPIIERLAFVEDIERIVLYDEELCAGCVKYTYGTIYTSYAGLRLARARPRVFHAFTHMLCRQYPNERAVFAKCTLHVRAEETLSRLKHRLKHSLECAKVSHDSLRLLNNTNFRVQDFHSRYLNSGYLNMTMP